MPTIDEWMKLNCGDRVRERDGAHIGRVEAIHNSSWVKVKWDDSDWLSFVPLCDLVRIKRGEQP